MTENDKKPLFYTQETKFMLKLLHMIDCTYTHIIDIMDISTGEIKEKLKKSLNYHWLEVLLIVV